VKWTADTLAQETATVASLPDVYTRLNEAVNDPRTSTRDVANVLNEDPGLAARLLRVANSAFYGFPSKIDTIVRAVTLIGTRQLRDLALATSVVGQFKGLPDDLVTMESFWRHSIACGVTARILATYRREPNVERYFVAGLMHDIGRLVIFGTVPELAREAMDEARKRGELLHKTERMVLGFDHADVGGALLQRWKLPQHTVNAVTFHHRAAADSGLHIDTAITHLADLIVNSVQVGGSGERFVPALDSSAWERLGLPESVLGTTLSELDRQYHDAVAAILPDATQ
jgi:putative nucleotidyltransferase with HDIG domain